VNGIAPSLTNPQAARTILVAQPKPDSRSAQQGKEAYALNDGELSIRLVACEDRATRFDGSFSKGSAAGGRAAK
jgi:hypothetical protein